MPQMEPEPVAEMVEAVAAPVLLSSLKFGSATGAIGLSIGGVAGVIRSKTPVLFSLASGIQCFTLGTSYWALRQSLLLSEARRQGRTVLDLSTSKRRQASTISGGLTGAGTAAIFRGRANIVPGAIMFSIFGFLGQAAYDVLDSKPVNTEDEQGNPGIFQRFLHSRFSPLKPLSDEEYADMLNEKIIRVEAELALIDEQLEELRSQQQSTSTSLSDENDK